MRKSLLALGATAFVLVGAGVGSAVAQAADTTPSASVAHAASMDAMHDRMRASMPAGLRKQCDAMHDQMGSMMGGGSSGHMGGGSSGHMGNSSMMSGTD